MSSSKSGSTGSKSSTGKKSDNNIRSAAQKWIDKADYMYPTELEGNAFPKRKLIPFIIAIILILTVGLVIIIYRINSVSNAPEPGDNNNSPGGVVDISSSGDCDKYLKMVFLEPGNSGVADQPEELDYEDLEDSSDDKNERETKKRAIEEYNQWVQKKRRTGKSSKYFAIPPFLLTITNQSCVNKLASVYHGCMEVNQLPVSCIEALNSADISPAAVPLLRRLQYALKPDFLENLDIKILSTFKPKVFIRNPLFPKNNYTEPTHPIQVIAKRKDELPPDSQLIIECIPLVVP